MATLSNIKTWDPEKKVEVPVSEGKSIVEGQARLVWEPMPFKSFGHTTRISNIELSRIITSEFKQTFHDILGTLITMPSVVNQFRVDMFFEYNADELPANMIRNLDSLVNPSKNSGLPETYVRQHAMYAKTNGKTYTLTPETKILLAPFMFGGPNANRANDEKRWNNLISETHYPSQSGYYMNRGADRVIIGVTGFDLRRIVRAVYGNSIVTHTVSRIVDGKIEDENFRSDAMYDVKFAAPAKNNSGEFYLNIEQYDDAGVKEIFAKENPMVQYGYGPVCY